MKLKGNRNVRISFVTHDEDAIQTAEFWASKTPAERLAAAATLIRQKLPSDYKTRKRSQTICKVVPVPWLQKPKQP